MLYSPASRRSARGRPFGCGTTRALQNIGKQGTTCQDLRVAASPRRTLVRLHSRIQTRRISGQMWPRCAPISDRQHTRMRALVLDSATQYLEVEMLELVRTVAADGRRCSALSMSREEGARLIWRCQSCSRCGYPRGVMYLRMCAAEAESSPDDASAGVRGRSSHDALHKNAAYVLGTPSLLREHTCIGSYMAQNFSGGDDS